MTTLEKRHARLNKVVSKLEETLGWETNRETQLELTDSTTFECIFSTDDNKTTIKRFEVSNKSVKEL